MSYAFRSMGTGTLCGQVLRHAPKQFLNLGIHIFRHFFVSKINGHLEQRHRTHQILAPEFYFLAEFAGKSSQCLFALRLGLCLDQIGQTFNLGQIHPIVFEGTTRELPRLRQAEARQRRQFIHQCCNDRRRAMGLKLNTIFTRETVGAFKREDERLIDHTSIGVTQFSQAGPLGIR